MILTKHTSSSINLANWVNQNTAVTRPRMRWDILCPFSINSPQLTASSKCFRARYIIFGWDNHLATWAQLVWYIFWNQLTSLDSPLVYYQASFSIHIVPKPVTCQILAYSIGVRTGKGIRLNQLAPSLIPHWVLPDIWGTTELRELGSGGLGPRWPEIVTWFVFICWFLVQWWLIEIG